MRFELNIVSLFSYCVVISGEMDFLLFVNSICKAVVTVFVRLVSKLTSFMLAETSQFVSFSAGHLESCRGWSLVVGRLNCGFLSLLKVLFT